MTATTPSTVALTLSPGEDRTDADFGFYDPPDPVVSIEGTVWFDVNADSEGVDLGEPGVATVMVQVWDVDDLLVASVATDATGYYLFETLAPGTYRVTVDETTIPAGLFVVTYDPTGPRDLSGTVVASVGDPRPIANFGLSGMGSIGDTVWYDANENELHDLLESGDPEPGIPSVSLTLTWLGMDGVAGGGDDLIYPIQSTDADGHYLFTNLPAGNYVVEAGGATGYVLVGDAVLSLVLVADESEADIALYADFPFHLVETLANTGASSDQFVRWATMLLAAGSVLLLVGRRREDRERA